jgi:hypothetical protein
MSVTWCTTYSLLWLTGAGVVPGRGLCPQDKAQTQAQPLALEGEGEGGAVAPRRRLSFMVGFWRTIRAKDRGPGCPGPGERHSTPHHYTSVYLPSSLPLSFLTLLTYYQLQGNLSPTLSLARRMETWVRLEGPRRVC